MLLVNSRSIVVAFAFAAAVGVLFGVWPRRAAALDPIESLGFEVAGGERVSPPGTGAPGRRVLEIGSG